MLLVDTAARWYSCSFDTAYDYKMTHCICTVYRLETVDGYYLGQVQWILDTAVSTLIVEYKFNWLTGILNLSLNFHLNVEYSQLPFTPPPPPHTHTLFPAIHLTRIPREIAGNKSTPYFL